MMSSLMTIRCAAGAVAVATVASLSISGASETSAERPRAAAPRPPIESDPIPYGAERRRQMANYSKRRYGVREWRLRRVRQIVLHYTVSSAYPPVFSAFASNAPNGGELPGVCAHFVVDKDGTIYQLVRLKIRCRHAIGLNHKSIGIEFVQEGGAGAETAILDRGKQRRAGLRLAAWLGDRFGVKSKDVIGHAEVNSSRYFRDRTGLRNDHGDWPTRYARKFRALLRDRRT